MTKATYLHTISPAGVSEQQAKYEAMATDALQIERVTQEAIALTPVTEEEMASAHLVNPAIGREIAAANVRLIDQVLSARLQP